MNILFHLGHPAHFHLFKNVIKKLHDNDHTASILIKKKDILEKLLVDANFKYENILPTGRGDSKIQIALGLLKQDLRLLYFCLKNRPEILVGTSVSIAHIGRILRIPSYVVNEDDFSAVPLFAKMAYPFATSIISPDVCNNGKWEYKSIKYNSYHELAYLHPENFVPDMQVVEKYIKLDRPFVLMRFASLGAHHDFGKNGIDDKLALKIIELIKPYANVYLTSERQYAAELEKYRLNINPLDIHHVISHAKMYIGDSQTMAAEAGVLGIPFIRYNDFVGKIGYLADLEDNYELGIGIKPGDHKGIEEATLSIIKNAESKSEYQKKRDLMLDDKMELSEYLYSILVNTK